MPNVFANILHDETFKVVLAEPSNRQLLINLIEFFLPGKKIKTLNYDDKEQHGLILSDKTSIFDLYCTTDIGEKLIIEMQFSSQKSFKDRMLYYATYPIRSQIMERMKRLSVEDESNLMKMDYSLSPVYVISILNFKMPHDNPETLEGGMISRYELRSARTGEKMTNALNFVFMELGRLKWKQGEEDKCKTLLEQLAYSLKYGHTLEDRPKEFENELLTNLFDATAFANMDEEQLENYNAIMTTELDIIAQKNFAREEGHAEGFAEGRAEGKAEGKELAQKSIALKMLQSRLSPEAISEYTGLSVDEIIKLKNN